MSRPKKHGLSSDPIYACWRQMKQRCLNPNSAAFKNYGARGITVCPEWVDSIENFKRDMGDRPSLNHTLERIDPNASYNKEICTWILKNEQPRNRRKSFHVYLEYKGELLKLYQVAERVGIDQKLLRTRLKQGMMLMDAIEKFDHRYRESKPLPENHHYQN